MTDDPKTPQRDLRGVDPPGTPRDAKPGGGFLKLVFLFVLLVAIGLVAAYSAKIGRPPWEWSDKDREGFVEDTKARADAAKTKLESFDWDNLKTRVTDKTRELWNGAPAQDKKLEERQARLKTRAPVKAPLDGAKGSPSGAGERAAQNYADGLDVMREGIAHYRRSPDNPQELTQAKKCFEQARPLLEGAVKEEPDAERRAEEAQTLDECNKYLEDCRAREKS
jgi:hypothetical protein